MWPNPRNVPRIPYKGEIIDAYVYDVHDGDTCSVLIRFGKEEHLKLNLRILGIDTPELKRGGSELEMKAGEKVRDVVAGLILGKECKIRLIKHDKYGSRVNGEVFLNDSTSLSQYLLDRKYAVPYTGNKKSAWDTEMLQNIITS